jgi:type IV pilus assembly protein PilA
VLHALLLRHGVADAAAQEGRNLSLSAITMTKNVPAVSQRITSVKPIAVRSSQQSPANPASNAAWHVHCSSDSPMLATPLRCSPARSSVVESRSAHAATAGFTLIELMVVVVIMGVLATLATYGVRKYVLEAKRGEAVGMLTQIRAAEEAYRDETFQYLGLDEFDMWVPTEKPGGSKNGWNSGTANQMGSMFATLGVMPDGPVEYSYSVVAGNVGDPIPTIPMPLPSAVPSPTGPFYIAMGMADLNDDGSYTYAIAFSASNTVHLDDKF